MSSNTLDPKDADQVRMAAIALQQDSCEPDGSISDATLRKFIHHTDPITVKSERGDPAFTIVPAHVARLLRGLKAQDAAFEGNGSFKILDPTTFKQRYFYHRGDVSFLEKGFIKSLENGQVVFTKTIQIDKKTFQLKIFPNQQEDDTFLTKVRQKLTGGTPWKVVLQDATFEIQGQWRCDDLFLQGRCSYHDTFPGVGGHKEVYKDKRGRQKTEVISRSHDPSAILNWANDLCAFWANE